MSKVEKIVIVGLKPTIYIDTYNIYLPMICYGWLYIEHRNSDRKYMYVQTRAHLSKVFETCLPAILDINS